MPVPTGQVATIPSGAAYGYPATHDPAVNSASHTFIAAGGLGGGGGKYVSILGSDLNGGTAWDDAFRTVEAAIASLPLDSNSVPTGTIFVGVGFGASDYTVSSVWNVSENVSIIGMGSRDTIIHCPLNGDHIRAKMTSWNTDHPYAGRLQGFTLVGNSGANAVGIHMGDIVGLELVDLYIQDFTAGVGLWQHNTANNGNSERTLILGCGFQNNAKSIRQTVTAPGNASMDYQKWLQVNFTLDTTGQVAISTETTAQMLRCVVSLVCNVRGSGTTTIVWNVQDTAIVDQCRIDFDAEQSAGSGAVAINVGATAGFSVFPGSHVNLAGMLMLLAGGATYTVDGGAVIGGVNVVANPTGTVTINADIFPTVLFTMNGNFTLAAPAHAAKGQYLRVMLRQDATGGRGVVWNAVFKFSGNAPKTGTPSAQCSVDFMYDGTNWIETSRREELQAGVISVLTPTIAPGVVNTTTETDIANFSVAGNTVKVGDVLMFDVEWDLLNNSGGSVNYTYRLTVGSTTLPTGALAVGASASRVGMTARFLIMVASMVDGRISGYLFGGFAGGGFTGINAANSGVVQPQTATVDFTAAVTVKLTGQMGTAAATVDFRPVSASLTRGAAV